LKILDALTGKDAPEEPEKKPMGANCQVKVHAENDAQFPVYLVEKISGDVDMYPSHEIMQSFLDMADVEKSGYEAYDSEGFVLRLSVDERQPSWLQLGRTENRLSVTDFLELKSNAVAHEQESRPLFDSLKRKLRLTER
jgi:hypothetical protein